MYAPAFIVLGHELIHGYNNVEGKRTRSLDFPAGHPAKNKEEYNTPLKDKVLFKENELPIRYEKSTEN